MAPPLSDVERLTIRAALEDLNTAFCHHLDHDDVDELLGLFTDDVYYTHGTRVSRGKAELEQVFRGRDVRGVWRAAVVAGHSDARRRLRRSVRARR